ncbi:MAG TPA: F0F1 ATP synthase subunit delta [Candidatus Saccharimonadales bacterium]|nr:F0F1 ATP synthase subunit delta [Candidatus Saccharimonadales bacterium]
MALELPTAIISPEDLASLELEVKDYARWFEHNQIKQRVGAKSSSQPPEVSASALELIRGCHGKGLLEQKHLDKLIDDLERLKSSATSLTITLAAPAPKTLKADIANWCRTNLERQVLIDFRFNSTILGGMVVRAGSHVYDWSWRRAILDNKAKFPEVLANV